MSRTSGTTPAARENYWTRTILEARNDPNGVTAYCKRKGISKDNYYYWFKRLRIKHPEWHDLENNQSKVHNNGNVTPQSNRTQPETEVVERPVRRTFTAAYKTKILNEVEASPGRVAAILRREGLYSSHLQKWRAEETRRASDARRRGPKRNPLTAEVRKLRAENERLEKKLTQANNIIELQKKIAEILETAVEKDVSED